MNLELKTSQPLRCDMVKTSPKKGKAVMFGVGIDGDGHKRVTTEPNSVLAGGSKGEKGARKEGGVDLLT